MLTTAIYARVSTEEQTENFSINAQLDLLRGYCRSMGYEIYREYVDPGFSGATQDRPALQKLLEDAEKGCFKMVLVYRIDRFFRSVKDLLIVVDHLDRLGIAFRSITEPFDTSNPIGKFMLSLLGSIAQLERDTFVERSRMGKIRRAQEGYVVISRPLLGYDYDREKKQLVINEEEAETVRLIFREYLKADASTLKIARLLDSLGRPTKRGGKWNGERVYAVLTQPAYAGDWYFKHRSKDDPSGWVRVPVPPIIDRATFERAQELLKERRNMIHRTTPREYLLRGLLKCRRCGWNMGGNTDDYYRKHKKKTNRPTKRAFYYRCLRNINSLHYPDRNLGHCDAPWVRGKELEENVLKLLTEILSDPQRLKEAIGQHDEAAARSRVKAESRIRELEKLIARAENEKDRLLAAYREGVIELPDLGREMDRVKACRQELERELEELKIKLTLEEEKVESIERLVEQYRDLSAEGLLEAPYEVKREFLSRLVQTIWVDTREDGTIQVDVECVIPGIELKESIFNRTPLASRTS